MHLTKRKDRAEGSAGKITRLPLRARTANSRTRAGRKQPPAQLIQFPIGKPRNFQPIEAKSSAQNSDSLPDLDISAYLIKRPGSTVFVRVGSDDLWEANLFQNDLVIVDLCEQGEPGDLVLTSRSGRTLIEKFSALEYPLDPNCIIRGKVLWSIRAVGRGATDEEN